MPDTAAPIDLAAEAREILDAAEPVTIAKWPTDRKDVLRVQPDNIDPAAVSVDSIAIHHGRNGNKAEAFRALDAAKAAMRAAGWYVLPLSGVSFRTAPGELPTPPASPARPAPEAAAAARALDDLATIVEDTGHVLTPHELRNRATLYRQGILPS